MSQCGSGLFGLGGDPCFRVTLRRPVRRPCDTTRLPSGPCVLILVGPQIVASLRDQCDADHKNRRRMYGTVGLGVARQRSKMKRSAVKMWRRMAEVSQSPQT